MGSPRSVPPTLTPDFSDKVVLVTGGSRGLGREIVLGFASRGADVIIASRDLAACEALAETVEKETAGRALAARCHVGRWQEVDSLAALAQARFDRVDVLVNNAGMSPHYDSPASISEELWDKVLAVNLKGPFRLAALIGEGMVAAGGGSIINISSSAATHPTAEVIPYAAAKAGMNAMTVALAHAFAPLVRVNSVAPGYFLTDVSANWDMEEFGRRAEAIALGRAGRPEEIVGTVLHLAGAGAGYTTGSVVAVDGGYA